MSSQLNGPGEGLFAVPILTEMDLASFHEAHFGKAALDLFAKDFLDPDKASDHGEVQYCEDCEGTCEEEYYYEDEEDNLGYYPDGAKRTLTDEQIAMFRHTELQALQRARDNALENKNNIYHNLKAVPEVEDGELPDNRDGFWTGAKVAKKKKTKKKRGSGKGSTKRWDLDWEPDPERRKRTWDVVETGLDGLDYSETGTSAPLAGTAAQRRRITYDDD